MLLTLNKEETGSHDSKNVRIQKGYGNVKSSVGSFQLFSDKDASSLRSIVLLVYDVHVILLSILARRK